MPDSEVYRSHLILGLAYIVERLAVRVLFTHIKDLASHSVSQKGGNRVELIFVQCCNLLSLLF